MATTADVLAWIKADLGRFNGNQPFFEEVGPDDSQAPFVGPDGSHRRWRLYTETNRYSISAVARSDPYERGYLGCIATSRKPRAGEDWHRGNDLADGPLHPDTWRRILADIVSYELVRVAEKTASQPDAEGVEVPETAEQTVLAAG